MKEFSIPIITEVTELTEGVFAAGGSAEIQPPPPGPTISMPSYSLSFCDYDSGGYNGIFFQVPQCPKEIKNITVNINWHEGTYHNKLKDVWSYNDKSGEVTSYSVQKEGDNRISLNISVHVLNSSGDVNCKFYAKWDHDELDCGNVCYTTEGTCDGHTNSNPVDLCNCAEVSVGFSY